MTKALRKRDPQHMQATRRVIPLLDQAPCASFLLDLQGKVIHANPMASLLLRRSPNSMQSLALNDFLHPDDMEQARWIADSLFDASRASSKAEHRFLDGTGEPFWVDTAVSLVRDETGEPECFWLQAIDIDSRKRLERTLSENERRWTHALENAGQGVWEADLVNDRVHYSPTWRKMRGLSADDPVDSSQAAWLSRIHPLDKERVLAHIQNAEVSRNVFEYRERHRDGHYIWIQSRGSVAEFDKDGRPTHIIGTDTDITEAKRSQSLQNSLSQRLEMALSISGIGVFEVNLGTGAISYDQRMREIFDIPAGQAVTMEDFQKALHPDDAERVLAANADLVVSKGSFASTFRIVRSNGEIRILKSHAAYFEDDNGHPMIIGTNWDVSEEVRLQESLIEANALAEKRYADLERASERIERLAMLDPLTDLSNRRHLDDVLARAEGPVALLHIDLDRFKQINDGHGHPAGDAVLRHVADVLRNASAPGDFIARVGGDEFVVLRHEHLGSFELELLASTIVSALSVPFMHKGQIIPIAASIGIASSDGETTADRLLGDADAALYRAKQTGRGRYEVFTDSLKVEMDRNKRTTDELLVSIDQKWFVPHYQPIVDAKTHEIVSVEALARWRHPDLGILPPSAFLPALNEMKALGAIDAIILERTINDLATWRAAGVPIPSASVNISFNRLQDESLIPTLQSLSFEPGSLNFELLESIFLDDVEEQFATNLEGIRNLGIGIDIDDFGTGHTSFLSLFKLHPRRFKIDRQLVTPILDSPEKRKIVKSIIGIGKTLGIKVVAEGVETMEHAHVLKRLGCNYLQGYAFAHPMPADALGAWCAERQRASGPSSPMMDCALSA